MGGAVLVWLSVHVPLCSGVCWAVALCCHVLRGSGWRMPRNMWSVVRAARSLACPNTATPVFPHFLPF